MRRVKRPIERSSRYYPTWLIVQFQWLLEANVVGLDLRLLIDMHILPKYHQLHSLRDHNGNSLVKVFRA